EAPRSGISTRMPLAPPVAEREETVTGPAGVSAKSYFGFSEDSAGESSRMRASRPSSSRKRQLEAGIPENFSVSRYLPCPSARTDKSETRETSDAPGVTAQIRHPARKPAVVLFALLMSSLGGSL